MKPLDPDIRAMFSDVVSRQLPPASNESLTSDSTAIWREMADTGVLGLGLPEASGGVGGGQIDLGVVMRAIGSALSTAPFLSSVVVGGHLLTKLQGKAAEEDLQALIGGSLKLSLAHFEPDNGFAETPVRCHLTNFGGQQTVTGRKTWILDADDADAFLVSARDSKGQLRIGMIDRQAENLSLVLRPTVDGRRIGTLTLDATPIRLLSDTDASLVLREAIDRATVAACAEALGAMEETVRHTREYLKTRRAFGRTLSQFQVLQHRFVDMLIALEETRAVVAVAEHACDQPDEDRLTAVATCKVTTSRAARFVAAQGVHLHGGVGMTDSLIISHYYKRLMKLEAMYGNGEHHLRVLSRRNSAALAAAADPKLKVRRA